MSIPIVFLVILAGLLLTVLGIVTWRVCGPPRVERTANGTLPLFGVADPRAVGMLPLRASPERAVGPWPHRVVGQLVRFGVPADAGQHQLPGALQVLTGPDAGRHIPFVRLPHAPDRAMTIGRRVGIPLHHVELRDPTASRSHAHVSHDGDGWVLMNLAADNPSEVNGRLLGPGERTRLTGGDHVRLGEVQFVYRA